LPRQEKAARRPDNYIGDAARFAEILHAHLDSVCHLSDGQIVALYAHFRLYERWNRALNLSSIRDLESAAVRHYCESLFLGSRLPAKPLSVIDVGSGAGFPGVPVAILRPDCRVCLVESHQRKAVFLKEATRGLSNVEVASERADQIKRRFDWLISRAVAWNDLRAVALTVASHVGVLVALADASNVMKKGGVVWEDPITLPWAPQSVVLIGSVSRGTC
jgi:16S rRNA (guanine527-N7)-methyltransferase